MNYIIGCLLAFLPARYRRVADVGAHAALISGAVELLVALGLLISRYFAFASHRLVGTTETVLRAAEKGGETAVMGSGLFILAEYFIQPLTLLLAYFAIEGLTRGVAATVTGEVLPTLPLQLIALIHGKAESAYAEHAAGPRVADEVRPIDAQLRIASCRAKQGWNDLITIAYGGELFEIVRVERDTPPRPFVYILRKKAESKVIRGIHYYDPGEVLPEKR